MSRARTKPAWWPKWPDTVCVGVDRGTVARAWCLGDRFAVGCGLWAVVCARRVARTVGSPWRNCCGGGRAPVAALRRRRPPRRDSPGDPRPAPRCVVRVPRPRRLHRSPSRRQSARTPLHGRQRLPLARCGLSPSPIARVHLGHACAARANRLRLAPRAPRRPCSSFGTGTPRRRLCVGAAIHQLRPMPDRTRSKRRRGAPRCRTSVYTDPARERTTNRTAESASR